MNLYSICISNYLKHEMKVFMVDFQFSEKHKERIIIIQDGSIFAHKFKRRHKRNSKLIVSNFSITSRNELFKILKWSLQCNTVYVIIS